MPLSLSTLFCLLVSLAGVLGDQDKAPPSRPYNQIITAPNGAPRGVWGPVEMCPEGTYANGFALKLQPPQQEDASKEENSMALNGVRLHCSDGTTIQSGVGDRGRWLGARFCPRGYIRAFSLYVELRQHDGDNAAATDLRVACSDGEVLARPGARAGAGKGPWGDACISGSVCGLQSRVTGPQGNDAALNDVRFFCCPP